MQVSEEYHVYGGPAEMKFISRSRPQTVDHHLQVPARNENGAYDQVSFRFVALFRNISSFLWRSIDCYLSCIGAVSRRLLVNVLTRFLFTFFLCFHLNGIEVCMRSAALSELRRLYVSPCCAAHIQSPRSLSLVDFFFNAFWRLNLICFLT